MVNKTELNRVLCFASDSKICFLSFKVMPLPVFPKSRKWKSCNAITNPMPLNNKAGIYKSRAAARYINNSKVSAKKGFKKEIAQWQELVVMSEIKQGDQTKTEHTNNNSDVNHFSNTLPNGSIETKTNLKLSYTPNNKTDKSMLPTNNNIRISSNTSGLVLLEKRPEQVACKQNGTRNDSSKNTVKRTNFRKLRSKNNSTRKKNKDEQNESHLGTQIPKSTSVAARKISPKMRNL